MEEAITLIIVIIALLILLPFVIKHIVHGLYWFLALTALGLFGALDYLFSASLFPNAPWVMWVVWGAVLGAALGFWTVAPVYGWRERRPLIIAAPFVVMLVIALFRGMVIRL